MLILWDGVRKACAAHAIAHGIRFTQDASHGNALTVASRHALKAPDALDAIADIARSRR